MLPRIAHDLRRRVKTHRLGIEQSSAEDIRVMAFHEGRGIGDDGKAVGMAFRKTVGTEALELFAHAFSEIARMIVLNHAFDQFLTKLIDPSGLLEGRHGTAQLIRSAGRKTRAFDGNLHGLFLEQGYTQRPLQNLAKSRAGIINLLQFLAAPQIRMHHVALDRAWPNDRHLDDDIVKLLRSEARQHGHLRAALDLKRAKRIGLGDHVISWPIIRRNSPEGVGQSLMLLQEIEGAAHAGEHAERQHIDLHEFQVFDIVLVPFDHLPVIHAGGLDGHQIVQPVARQHEAARMLGEMARRVDQLASQFEE